MNRRTRILIYILIFCVVGGLALGTHAMIIKPYLNKRDELAAKRIEVAADQLKLDSMLKNNEKLQKVFYRQSIGSDSASKAEYQTALLAILGKIYQPSEYKIVERPSDSRNIPELAKGKPAYQRILYTITLAKTDVIRLTEFMKRFYELDLLHHITHCNLKREGTIRLTPDDRQANERKDITATLTIEAIVLDGVPARKYLASPPVAVGGLLSGAGAHVLNQDLDQHEALARAWRPEKINEMLAIPAREYSYIAARDAFHGELPPYKKPEPKPVTPPEPPKPLGPDYSPYISLNFVTRGSDGDYVFSIKDSVNNYQYLVYYSMENGKPSVQVEKYISALNSGRVRDEDYKNSGMLIISDPISRTKHNFTIYGVQEAEPGQVSTCALILGEVETPSPDQLPALPKSSKGSTKNSSSKSGSSKTTPATAGNPFAKSGLGSGSAAAMGSEARAALIGNLVLFAGRPEKFYRWSTGRTLKDTLENHQIRGEDVEQTLRQIRGNAAAVSTLPREVKNPLPKPASEVGKLEVLPNPRAETPEGTLPESAPMIRANPVREQAPDPVPVK